MENWKTISIHPQLSVISDMSTSTHVYNYGKWSAPKRNPSAVRMNKIENFSQEANERAEQGKSFSLFISKALSPWVENDNPSCIDFVFKSNDAVYRRKQNFRLSCDEITERSDSSRKTAMIIKVSCGKIATKILSRWKFTAGRATSSGCCKFTAEK